MRTCSEEFPDITMCIYLPTLGAPYAMGTLIECACRDDHYLQDGSYRASFICYGGVEWRVQAPWTSARLPECIGMLTLF